MLRLGALELGAIPRIAVPFDAANLDRVDEARAIGIDLAELRVDRLETIDSDSMLAAAARLRGLPMIGTIRTLGEGGGWTGDEEVRGDLLVELLPHVDAVDIELASEGLIQKVGKATRAADKLLIASHHDFEATPDADALVRILREARRLRADVVKIATYVRDAADLETLTRLCLEHHDFPLAVMGLGPRGAVTRVALPALGSLFTFGYLGSQTAPGQLELARLVETMRLLYPEMEGAS